MADSLLLSFSSNGSSRPPSRAHSHASDATERPDTASSTRTLTREVDHIKHLIKRSQNASQPQSITAQIFRQRSVTTPITLDVICHELDVLKRRIKEEQQQLQLQPQPRARPVLEVDPDASESEAEVEDILDEREEELERAREEIRVVKQNEEQLLEAAESRVDRLTGEKESLESTLSGYKRQLEALRSTLQKYEVQLNQLHQDNKDKSSSCDEARKQISYLQGVKTQTDTTLKLSSARVSQLEEESRIAAEQVKRLVSQHDTRQKELIHEIQTLNGRHSEISAEVEGLRVVSRTLQEKLDKAQAQSARAKKEHDSRYDALREQAEEHRLSSQNASQEAVRHTKELEALQDEQDKRQFHAARLEKQIEQYDQKLTAALHEHGHIIQTHQNHIQNIRRDHDQALRESQAGRESQMKQLQETLDEARSAHTAEVDVLKDSKIKELDSIRAQWHSSLQKVEASRKSEVESASAKLADELLRLKTTYDASLENAEKMNRDQIEALETQLAELEAHATAMKDDHRVELGTLRSKHEGSLKAAADEAGSVKQMMQRAESTAGIKVKELQKLLALQTENAEASLAKVTKSEADHRSRVAELEENLEQAQARLEAARSTAENREKGLRSQVKDLATELSSKGMEVTTLNADLRTAQQTKGDQVQALKAEITALSKEVASKETSMRTVEKAQASALDELIQKHADNTKELNSLHAVNVDQLRLDFKQAADSSGEEHVQKIAGLNKTHQNVLEQAKLDKEHALRQLNSQHASEIARTKHELAETVIALKQTHENALLNVNTRVQQAEEDLALQIKQLTAEHVNALTKFDATAEQDRQVAVQEVQQSAEARLLTLRAEHKEALERLVSGHGNALKQMKQRAVDRQTELEHDLAHQREVAAAREKHWTTEQEKALGAVDNRNQLKMNELTSRHATELGIARLEAQKRVSEMKASQDARLSALADKHAKSTAELQNQHTRVVEDLQQRHTSSQKLYESELSKTKEQQADLAQKLKIQHDSTVSEIKSEHARQAEAVQDKHEERIRKFETDRQNLEDSFQHDNAQVQHRHEAEIKRLEHCLQEQRDEAVSNLKSVSGELSRAQEVKLGEVQRAHDTQIDTLTTKLVESQKKLELAEASSRTDHAQLVTQHQKHVAELEEGWSRTRDESAAVHRADLQRAADEASRQADAAKNDFQEQIAEHEFAAEARITDLQEHHTCQLAQSKADLAVQIETAHNQVESSKAELAKARDAHGAAVEKLRVEHLGQTEALRAQHNEAYGRLQSQHENDVEAIRKDFEATNAAAATHHESNLAQLRRERSSELQQIQIDHDAAHEHIKSEHRSEVAELREDVAEGLSRSRELKAQHDRQLEETTSAHASELSSVRSLLDQQGSEHATRAAVAERQLAALRVDHATALSIQSQGHGKAMADMTAAHRAASATSQQERHTALRALREEHSKAIEDVNVAHQVELDGLCTKHDAAVAEVQAKHEQSLRELQEVAHSNIDGHAKELQQVREAAAIELERVLQEHQTTLEDIKQADERKDAEHAAVEQDQAKTLTDLKHQLEKDLEGLTSLHRTEAENLRSSYERQLAEARSKHEQFLTELAQQSNIATAAKVKQLQTDHEAALLKAVTETDVEAAKKFRLAEQQHRAALEFAVDRARHSGEAEVKNLKKRHQDAVAQIRTMAQQQTAAQLTDLENSHQQERQAGLLQARLAAEQDLQATIESHQSEILRLGTEHQTMLDALQTRLESERTAETTAKGDSHRREVEAMQTRLDATMTSRAEADRSVARLRQQVSQAEQRIAEDKLSSEDDISALQQERNDLTTQLRQVQDSLRDLQGRSSHRTTTPKTKQSHEELAFVKSQLSTLEDDRAILRLTLQKRLDEKNDLIRQNDFLVQELETLHAQRLRPQYTSRKTRDALVQTEDFVSEEPKVDLTSFQDIKASRRKSARPVTPMSPDQRQAKDEIDMAWKTRSFEDYLHNAKTELSELGSVITANETLFAQKIQEHVGELQRVKDELAADYKSKLNDLATDKQKMEQMVTSKQTAAFAKDRQRLVASYGADREDPGEQVAVLTSLPVSDAVALRTAEERLVQDYNKRIAKRKSQIALRHADEFRALTEEYDKKVAQLLDTRHDLEGDLSVDPWRFERDLDDLRSETVQLESGKERSVSNSPLAVRSQRGRAPKQAHSIPAALEMAGQDATDRPKTAHDSRRQLERWTSHPRTSTSIPRSSSVPRGSYPGHRESPEPPAVPKVLFPGNRDSPHSTSQPYQGRGKYPPVAERSLLRTKNPPDVQEQRRVFTEPSPRKTPTKRGSEKAAQTLGITPTEVERQGAQAGRGTESPTKPGFLRRVRDRMSIDGHRPVFHRPGRPGSRNELPTTPEPVASSPAAQAQAPTPAVPTGPSYKKRQSRSTKLSSGMIYYQAPKQSPTTEYE